MIAIETNGNGLRFLCLSRELQFTHPHLMDEDWSALRTNVYGRAVAFLQKLIAVSSSDRRYVP